MTTNNSLTIVDDYELTDEELESWTKLTEKARKAYIHHSASLNKLLKVSEQFAIDFDYL